MKSKIIFNLGFYCFVLKIFLKLRYLELEHFFLDSKFECANAIYVMVSILIIFYVLKFICSKKNEKIDEHKVFCKRMPTFLCKKQSKIYTDRCLQDLKRDFKDKLNNNLKEFVEIISKLENKNE